MQLQTDKKMIKGIKKTYLETLHVFFSLGKSFFSDIYGENHCVPNVSCASPNVAKEEEEEEDNAAPHGSRLWT